MSTTKSNNNKLKNVPVQGKLSAKSDVRTDGATPTPIEEPVCKKKGFLGWLKEKVYSKEELEAIEAEKREKAKQEQKEREKGPPKKCK